MGKTRTALVTGGSRGLGLEIARALASEGYRVTIVGRGAASLDAAVRSFDGQGHRAWALDLAQPATTHELLRRMEAEPFDLVVNNAGATRFGLLAELPAELIEEIVWLNFTAPALIGRQFLRTAAAGATLVNVTSAVAVVPMPGNTLYSAAKAALKALSEGLWFEARARGVRVIEFRPVSLQTEFHARAGRASLAGERLGAAPADAARDLVRALRKSGAPTPGGGLPGQLLGILNRLLPRKALVAWLGRRAAASGYLGAPAAAAGRAESAAAEGAPPAGQP